MSKTKILLQLDTDPHPSSFDAVVAVDSGVDHLLQYGNVTSDNVVGLVHGAMFTRGPADLKNTAIFLGGSDVQASEAIFAKAKSCFFGPIQVSVFADPNGSNTTAAAAVLCAEKHLELAGKTITILAGTGPVGQRIAQIISHQVSDDSGTIIRVCSRKLSKAQTICDYLTKELQGSGTLVPVQSGNADEAMSAIENADVVFAAGAAGIELLPESWLASDKPPAVAIDLNAVPPAGIAKIEVMDKSEQRKNTICYGAIGVGGLKMKIHKRCIASLFESNDQCLNTQNIYEIGRELS